MVTLALDTSHPVGSVALARDGELLRAETFREPASHLLALGQTVDHVISATKFAPAQINRIAVVTGPGSFTGLRIGLSFAKGLHAATDAQIVTMNALHLLALPLLANHARVCAMIDARRGEIYAALYEHDAGELTPPQAVVPSQWFESLTPAPDVFVGTGAHAYREQIQADFPDAAIAGPTEMYPSTAHLATVAHTLQPLDEKDIRALEPLYVRASGAEQKKLRAHARPGENIDG